MKRVMLAAGVVAALAAAANAAQVNLFFTSSADPLAATPALAIANNHNPVVPAGSVPIDLWMAIPTSALSITGVSLDALAAGGSTGSAFPYDNSTARWQAAISSNAAAGSIWSGFNAATLGTPVGPSGLQPTGAGEGTIGNLLVYHLGSGTMTGVAGDAVYLTIPDFASIGNTQGNAFAAFGFGGVGVGGSLWDTSGYYTNDGSDAPGSGSANGFEADGASNGPVSTRLPDITVLPEPTTLALMGLAGLLIRRRK